MTASIVGSVKLYCSNLNAVKLTTGNFGAAAPPCGFGPTALYEFSYIAKDPLIVGLGFAAIRDLATFLRHAETDDHGTANPLAGDVKYIYTDCASQACRMAHDFVYWALTKPMSLRARVPTSGEIKVGRITSGVGGRSTTRRSSTAC